ncbi:Hint domain-containing protein [Paenirhodobacter sp.]|uniref:Hint domain-containing protein n=1 Tax=Paenirhodobacter sp. TaxID=1965326 RepID=UPI003B4219AE
MTTALDLAPDNFAVIIDASTLAKLGRMGTDEFGFLNSIFASNREIYVTGTILRELLAAPPSATGSARAVRWILENYDSGNIHVVGAAPSQVPPNSDLGEISIRDYVTSHPNINFVVVTDDARVINDPLLLGDFGNAPTTASLTVFFLQDMFFSGGLSVFDFGRALIEASGLPEGSSLAQISQVTEQYAWLTDFATGQPVLVTSRNGSISFEIELLANGSVRVTTATESATISPTERFYVNDSGHIERNPDSIAEVLGKDFCFIPGTLISTPTGTAEINSLLPGDLVLAFDPSADLGRGALVPKRVVRLFQNETEEWLRLSWREGGEDRELTVTPGHRFLDTEGRFRRIDEIIEDAAPTVVLADGALAQVRAERIVWSEATRHLFEEVETVAMAAGDGLAHRTGGAWRSYNFEVEDLHTYVAGGVRVHNDSQKTIDLAENLGRVFGAQMANVILNGESQFTKLLGGTVLGAVTENLAEVITSTSYHMFDAHNFSFNAHNFSFKESFADALKAQVNNIKPEFVEKPSSVHGFADGCRAR